MQMPPPKALLTILSLAALFCVPDMMQAFRGYKVLDWSMIPSVLEFAPRRPTPTPVEDEELRLRPETDVAHLLTPRMADPAHSLDGFYAALLRVEQRRSPGAVVRVLHYGDSPTTADMITADVRSLLQKQFGDSGHGFVLAAKPWEWYSHRGVTIEGHGWQIDPATQGSIRDGLFGLGGVSFRNLGGARTSVAVRDRTHTRVEIDYLSQPEGGSFTVYADGSPVGTVNTSAASARPAFASFRIPGGAGRFEIREVNGKVRLFGVRIEKDSPGVVYNSLGLNGAYVSVLARFFNESHWAEQLRHYQPDLVVINYGTNESVYEQFVDTVFEKELRATVQRIRRALPEASILLMSPMDRGKRLQDGQIGTVPALQKVVTAKQRVAAETGCAFFNTFEAMGGTGTMGRWYTAEPRLVGADFIHPMPSGAKIVGGLLYKAILGGYQEYKSRVIRERFAIAGAGQSRGAN